MCRFYFIIKRYMQAVLLHQIRILHLTVSTWPLVFMKFAISTTTHFPEFYLDVAMEMRQSIHCDAVKEVEVLL